MLCLIFYHCVRVFQSTGQTVFLSDKNSAITQRHGPGLVQGSLSHHCPHNLISSSPPPSPHAPLEHTQWVFPCFLLEHLHRDHGPDLPSHTLEMLALLLESCTLVFTISTINFKKEIKSPFLSVYFNFMKLVKVRNSMTTVISNSVLLIIMANITFLGLSLRQWSWCCSLWGTGSKGTHSQKKVPGFLLFQSHQIQTHWFEMFLWQQCD